MDMKAELEQKRKIGSKPLEEWTLKECKVLCETTLDCIFCPLARICGENGLGIPEELPIDD